MFTRPIALRHEMLRDGIATLATAALPTRPSRAADTPSMVDAFSVANFQGFRHTYLTPTIRQKTGIDMK